MIGTPSDQASLVAEAQFSKLRSLGQAVTALAYARGVLAYHLPATQAHDLGVTLTQTAFGDTIGIPTGTVLNAASDTIGQFITASHATLTPTSTSTSTSPILSSGAAQPHRSSPLKARTRCFRPPPSPVLSRTC